MVKAAQIRGIEKTLDWILGKLEENSGDERMNANKERFEEMERQIKEIEKTSDWILERLNCVPEKIFSDMDW